MHYVLAGASGLIGTALRESLAASGDTYTQLVRRPTRAADESTWDPASGVIDARLVADADVVVNLAGASIGGKRLTASYAREVLTSRIDATGLLARTLADHGSRARLLQGSSIGIYGDAGTARVTERSEPGKTLLAGIAAKWEASAAPAVEAGIPTVFLRTGLVLAAHGGLAKRLMPAVKYGLVKSLGDGKQWIPWVSLDDEVRAIRFLADSNHAGAVNLCGPSAATNAQLIGALGGAARRPSVFPVPAWVLRLVVGPAIEDLLASTRVMPDVLTRLGFEWTHPTVGDAARWVISELRAAR